MAEIVRMPRLSDTMQEGVIVAWHKKVGDKVKTGDLLAEIETDKAVMEFESFLTGTLLHIGVEKGKPVPVDAVIAILGKEGEDISALLNQAAVPAAKTENKASAASTTTAVAVLSEDVKSATVNHSGRVKASPLAKKIAREKGIDIQKISGSGDDGRIVKRDIEQQNAKPALVFSGKESFTDTPVSQMRKTIARRLTDSKNSAPHFYLKIEVNMDAAIAARRSLQEETDSKISFNDFIIKAASLALRQHPAVNSSWLGDKIRTYNHVHIGVAVAMEDGLIVPVVRFADNLNLMQIHSTVDSLAAKARDRKLQPADWEGNTFTISNLGMFDIDEFTAIINSPEACILAVGKIKEQAILRDGALKNISVMKLTMSCDHRVVDGATGAKFLQTLKSLLEDPVKMLLAELKRTGIY